MIVSNMSLEQSIMVDTSKAWVNWHATPRTPSCLPELMKNQYVNEKLPDFGQIITHIRQFVVGIVNTKGLTKDEIHAMALHSITILNVCHVLLLTSRFKEVRLSTAPEIILFGASA